MIRTCSICGKEFEAKSPKAKYCSFACSQKGKYLLRKEWEKETGFLESQRQRMQKYRSEMPVEKKNEQLEKNRIRRIKYQNDHKDRICKQCGKPFVYTTNLGHAWFCSDECAKRWKYEHDGLRKAQEGAIRRCAEWLQNGVPDNFTVLSEWTEGDGNVEIEIRCNDCGGTFKKQIYLARHTKHCPLCWKRSGDSHPRKYGNMDDYKAVLEAKRQESLERKEKEREERKQVKICEICGAEFETYQSSRVCCSHECSVKHAAEKNRARKDKRINESNLVDKDITLMRLFKRDNGTCWICGGKCNYSDFSIGSDGLKKCGENYPSIDHIVPLARGGMHAWKNVALAHLKCNILKSDSIQNLGISFDYPEIRGKTRNQLRKTVFQFDLNDNLVEVYESTVEAEKSTGIKQRGIQKCARGEAKTYKGFKWKYDECERNKAS